MERRGLPVWKFKAGSLSALQWMPVLARLPSGGRCLFQRTKDCGRPLLGLNGHWAWLVATIALLLPAVARSVNLPSVRFLRPRTGALDPLPPLRFEKSCRPTFEFTGLARLYAQGPVE